MASEDIIVRMGMDATAFNRGLQSSRKSAEAASSAMASLEKAIKDRTLERMSVTEKITALRKEELELINRAFAAESAGNKAAAAQATLAALNIRTERERLITQEKQRQVQLEKQLADETKRVADASAKQAASEAKFRADLSERVRLEKQAAQLRHAPRARESGGIMSGIGGVASSVAGAFGIGVGLAAIVGWLGRVSERMAGLRRQAEDLGASMRFMAGLSTLEKEFDAPAGSASKAMTVLVEQIGKARNEGGEALEKFQQFGIELYDAQGNAKSGEQVFKAIASAIANAGDASAKAAMTYAFFGKTGREVNNILGMGGAALDAFVAAQGRSEKMLQAQAKNWEQIRTGAKSAAESAGNYASKLALGFRAMSAMGKGVLLGDIRGQMAVMREELRPESQTGGTRAGDALMNQAAIQKRQAEELARVEKERAQFIFEQANDAERLTILDRELVESVRRMHELQSGSAEKAKEELEFIKKKAEWQKLVNKQAEEGVRLAEDAKAENQKLADAMLAQLNQFTARKGELESRVGEVESARADRSKFTLAELASANISRISDPKLREDILKAREAARLVGIDGKGGLAEQARLRGDVAGAERMFTKADALKSGLSFLKSSELTSIAIDIAKVNAEVHQFNVHAEAGFKVRPVMAD